MGGVGVGGGCQDECVRCVLVMNRAVIITEELCALTRGFFSTDVGLRHTFVAHSSSLLVILCLSEKAFSHSFMALFF